MEIKPFKAFRFNENKVGGAGNCIAPPYDVISSAQQEQLYQKSEYNIVRIIKGEKKPCDNDNNNQYTRAANYLNSWIEKAALKQDPAESIYTYVQDFELAGASFRRLSFVALAKLEEFGKIVRPHEQTLNKPKIDRLNLKRATAATFGLVFMLYEDKENIADRIIEKNINPKPLIDFTDEQNVRHRLFAIIDKADIEKIVKMMNNKTCIIADGHHRYETGLIYSKETDNSDTKYQMIALCNPRHDGLIVLATHRLVGNLEDFNMDDLLAGLKENFEITEYQFDSSQSNTAAKQKMLTQMKVEYNRNKNTFGIYSGGSSFYVAILKNEKAMDNAVPNMSAAWRSLDVSVLHKLILEKLLGIDEEKLAKGENIKYIKSSGDKIDELITNVASGREQVVFFMNPPRIKQIQMVADEGERMPQKSTYFYPKVYTGLTINKL